MKIRLLAFLLGAEKEIKWYVEQMNMVHILIRKAKNRNENRQMLPSLQIFLSICPWNIYGYFKTTYAYFRNNRNENSKKSVWVTRNMGLHNDLYELYCFDHFWMVSRFVTILWHWKNFRKLAHILSMNYFHGFTDCKPNNFRW